VPETRYYLHPELSDVVDALTADEIRALPEGLYDWLLLAVWYECVADELGAEAAGGGAWRVAHEDDPQVRP